MNTVTGNFGYRAPLRRRRTSAPRGRVATVAALVKRLTLETGTPPSNAELARLLATSETNIAKARGTT